MPLMYSKGIGAQVEKTVTNKNDFLPHTSERAPIKGAQRNDKMPYMEYILSVINQWSTSLFFINIAPNFFNSSDLKFSWIL